MASAADSYLTQVSMMKDDESPDFTSKQWTFINDINQGNYSNKQLMFDMSGFFNAARFLSFSEMVLVIPIVTTLSPDSVWGASSSGTVQSGMGPVINEPTGSVQRTPTSLYSMGYKSGYWNFIYSMSVNADGVDVVQLQPNMNYYSSYKAITTWSKSDVEKHGPFCGFLPDSDLSWGINATGIGRENGYGVYNNSLPPKMTYQTYSPDAGAAPFAGVITSDENANVLNSNTPDVNTGLYQRMLKTSRFVTAKPQAVGDYVYDPKYVSISDGTLSSDFMSNLGDGCFPYSASGSQTSQIADSTCGTSARIWITTAYIRLKDCCDFFSKLPLCRSLNLKLIINVNTGHLGVYQPNLLPKPATPIRVGGDFGTIPTAVVSHVLSAGGDPRTLKASSGAQAAGGVPSDTICDFGYSYIFENTFQTTCPVMLAKCVSSLQTNESIDRVVSTLPSSTVEADPYPGLNCGLYSQYRNAMRLSVAIAAPESSWHTRLNSGVLDGYKHPLKSCRLYIPSVEMVPSKAIRYLENHKQQQIVYDDIYNFTYLGIISGTQFNYMAANNVANAKYLVVIPFYHDDTTQTGTAASNAAQPATQAPRYYNWSTSLIPYQPISPFDSAPATTAPGCILARYNVLLSNQTVYQRDREYDFETFLEEVSEVGAINGGLDTGLTSGLVDFRKWSNNYRYYVTNLARRLEGDNTPKSITIQGVNRSAYKIDLQIFVVYSKKISLDVGTGRVSV